MTPTEAAARACKGYRRKLARRLRVSPSLIDKWFSDPSSNPFERVCVVLDALHEMRAPEVDEILVAINLRAGYHPPIPMDEVALSRATCDLHDSAEALLARVAPHADVLASQCDALASIVSITAPLAAARHGPRRRSHALRNTNGRG